MTAFLVGLLEAFCLISVALFVPPYCIIHIFEQFDRTIRQNKGVKTESMT